MAHNYIVTTQPSMAVDACDTGNLTSSNDLNLVIARNNKIEIMLITQEGLQSIREFNINGSVEVMKLFRPVGATKDRLFIITKRQQVMILEVQTLAEGSRHFEVVTKSSGDVSDMIGKIYFKIFPNNCFVKILKKKR